MGPETQGRLRRIMCRVEHDEAGDDEEQVDAGAPGGIQKPKRGNTRPDLQLRKRVLRNHGEGGDRPKDLNVVEHAFPPVQGRNHRGLVLLPGQGPELSKSRHEIT